MNVTRQIRLAERYARFVRHLGNRCFDQTGNGQLALSRGWRAAAYADGWAHTVRSYGACRLTLRQATRSASL